MYFNAVALGLDWIGCDSNMPLCSVFLYVLAKLLVFFPPGDRRSFTCLNSAAVNQIINWRLAQLSHFNLSILNCPPKSERQDTEPSLISQEHETMNPRCFDVFCSVGFIFLPVESFPRGHGVMVPTNE